MAENQRHRAASSRSVNSYWPGPERHPDSAADLRRRIISGKGMTLACSKHSFNVAPTHRAPRYRGGDPHSSRRRQSPIPANANSAVSHPALVPPIDEPETRVFAEYFPNSDRYSQRAGHRWKNTIEQRFG